MLVDCHVSLSTQRSDPTPWRCQYEYLYYQLKITSFPFLLLHRPPLSLLSTLLSHTAHQFLSTSLPFPPPYQHCWIRAVRVCRQCVDGLPANYGTKRPKAWQVRLSALQVHAALATPRLIIRWICPTTCASVGTCVRVHVRASYLCVWASVCVYMCGCRFCQIDVASCEDTSDHF